MQRYFLGFIGLCWIVGCSSASIPGTVPAGGKVTYKGTPVEGAIVTFHPEGQGRIATATTVSGGAFSLTTVDASGALPGRYKVTVDKQEFAAAGASSMEAAATGNAAEGKSKRLLPAKYAKVASTPVAVEVPSSGKKDFDISVAD